MLCPNCKRYSGKSGDFCPKCGAFIPSDNSKYYDYNCAGEDDGSGLYKKLKPKPRGPVRNYRSYDPTRTPSQAAPRPMNNLGMPSAGAAAPRPMNNFGMPSAGAAAPRPVNNPNMPYATPVGTPRPVNNHNMPYATPVGTPRPVNNHNMPPVASPRPAQGAAQQAPASQPNGQFGRPYVKKNGANPAAFIAIAVVLLFAFLPSMFGVLSRIVDNTENPFEDELFTIDYSEDFPDIITYGTYVKMDNFEVVSADIDEDNMVTSFSFTAEFYLDSGAETIPWNDSYKIECGYVNIADSIDSVLYYNDGIYTVECYLDMNFPQTITEIVLNEYDEFENIVGQCYAIPSEDENTLIFSENNNVIVTSAY